MVNLNAEETTGTTPNRHSSKAEFRPDIEGLRAVAVLAVVLFHAGVPGMSGGFVGVDVFFVISGFLITGLLWRETRGTGTVNLRRFYGARARRLLPASATVGVITMFGSVLLLPPLQVKTVSIDAITSALYVSNYWFAASGINYFGKDGLLSPSPFQHYWSLGVEEQFYLVWPVLIIGTARLIRRIRRDKDDARNPISERPFLAVLTVVACLSFALSLVITYVLPPAAYFSLPTRAWQLAVGGLIALTATQWRRLPPRVATVTGWTGLALILLSCTRLSAATTYPGTAALWPTLGAALIIGAGCAAPSRGCGLVLGLSPMGAIGRVSYSWYLWHWPVLVLAPVLLGHRLSLPEALAAALFSGGLAVLTLRFIENPLRFADPIRRSAKASLTLGGAVTAVAVFVGAIPLISSQSPVGPGPAIRPIVLATALTARGANMEAHNAVVREAFSQVHAAVSSSVEMGPVPSNLEPPLTDQTAQFKAIMTNGCLRLPLQGDQPTCVEGDANSTTSVALIGDSRAAMLNPAFQRIAEQRQWRLSMLSKAACPIVDLPLTARFNRFAEEFQRCSLWRDQIMARLHAERPKLVVISTARAYGRDGTGIWKPAGFELFNAAWIGAISQTVRELRGTGARVLVLGPTPDAAASVPECLSGHLDDASACSASAFQKALDPTGIAAEAAAIEAAGGQYADISTLFCAEGLCPAVVGNIMVYFDAGHLTREYSQFLAPALAALSERALANGPSA